MARFPMRLALLVFCVAPAVGPAVAHAGPLALTFTGGAVNSSATDVMAGWRFSMNTSEVVDGLGVWDYQGNGLSAPHQVGIWTDAGTLVASAFVAAGTT